MKFGLLKGSDFVKKKIFLIIMGLLFLTGCSSNYNLTITSDKRFVEEVTIVLARDAFPGDKKQVTESIESNIEGYKTIPEFRDYNYDYKISDDKIIIVISGEHLNFEMFRMSPIYKRLFERVTVVEDGTYRFSSGGEYYNINAGISPDPNFYVEDFDVNIRAHNKVLSTNADIEDFRKNTFTWNIKGDELDRKIEMELDYSKRYDIIVIDFFLNNLVTTISVIILVFGSLFFGAYLVSQNKLKNKL